MQQRRGGSDVRSAQRAVALGLPKVLSVFVYQDDTVRKVSYILDLRSGKSLKGIMAELRTALGLGRGEEGREWNKLKDLNGHILHSPQDLYLCPSSTFLLSRDTPKEVQEVTVKTARLQLPSLETAPSVYSQHERGSGGQKGRGRGRGRGRGSGQGGGMGVAWLFGRDNLHYYSVPLDSPASTSSSPFSPMHNSSPTAGKFRRLRGRHLRNKQRFGSFQQENTQKLNSKKKQRSKSLGASFNSANGHQMTLPGQMDHAKAKESKNRSPNLQHEEGSNGKPQEPKLGRKGAEKNREYDLLVIEDEERSAALEATLRQEEFELQKALDAAMCGPEDKCELTKEEEEEEGEECVEETGRTEGMSPAENSQPKEDGLPLPEAPSGSASGTKTAEADRAEIPRRAASEAAAKEAVHGQPSAEQKEKESEETKAKGTEGGGQAEAEKEQRALERLERDKGKAYALNVKAFFGTDLSSDQDPWSKSSPVKRPTSAIPGWFIANDPEPYRPRPAPQRSTSPPKSPTKSKPMSPNKPKPPKPQRKPEEKSIAERVSIPNVPPAHPNSHGQPTRRDTFVKAKSNGLDPPSPLASDAQAQREATFVKGRGEEGGAEGDGPQPPLSPPTAPLPPKPSSAQTFVINVSED